VPAGVKLIVDEHRNNRLVTTGDVSAAAGGFGQLRPPEPLSADAIAVLYDVVHSARDRGWHDHPDPRVRSGVSQLRRAGLLVAYRGRLRPSDAVIKSLENALWKTQAALAIEGQLDVPDNS
jgi:hypothetical protein